MHVFRFNVCRSRISESGASPDGLPTVHTTHTITFLIYSQLNTFSLPLHSHARAHAFVERERVFHIVCLLQVASVRRLFVDEMARVYEESGDDFEPSPDLMNEQMHASMHAHDHLLDRMLIPIRFCSDLVVAHAQRFSMGGVLLESFGKWLVTRDEKWRFLEMSAIGASVPQHWWNSKEVRVMHAARIHI